MAAGGSGKTVRRRGMQMERKRCQICDGPIVDGRCKLCGMPYRNDAVLYHLNENRRDHYKHAGRRAKSIMDSYVLPGEENAAQKTKKGSAAGGGKSAQKISMGSGKSAQKASTGSRKSAQKTSAGGKTAQRTSTGRIAIIMILLVALGYNFISEKVREEAESQRISEELDERSVIGENVTYALMEGETLNVGEFIPEGDYIFCCPEGEMTVRITNGEETSFFFMEEEAETEFNLREGDTVTLEETEFSGQELWIWQIIL